MGSVCVYDMGHAHALKCRSEDNPMDSVLYFHLSVGLRNYTQVTRPHHLVLSLGWSRFHTTSWPPVVVMRETHCLSLLYLFF